MLEVAIPRWIQWIRNASLNSSTCLRRHFQRWQPWPDSSSRRRQQRWRRWGKMLRNSSRSVLQYIFCWEGANHQKHNRQPYGLKPGRWRFPCVGLNPITKNIPFDYEWLPHLKNFTFTNCRQLHSCHDHKSTHQGCTLVLMAHMKTKKMDHIWRDTHHWNRHKNCTQACWTVWRCQMM